MKKTRPVHRAGRAAPVRQVDHMIRDTRREVLSLRKKTVTIELSSSLVSKPYMFFRRYGLRMSFAVVFLLVVGVGIASRTHADVTLYAHTCLGGWEGSSLASGPPEAKEGEPNSYTAGNSATISNSIAELFCASFTGEPPKDTHPTQVQVHISWASHMPIMQVLPADSTGSASSTNAIIDSSSDTVLQSSSTDATQPATPASVHPSASPTTEPAPSDTPIQTPAPVSTEPTPTPDAPSQTSAPSPSNSDAPVSLLNSFIAPIAHAQESTTTSIVVDASSSEAVQQNTLDVSYTVDGTTWHSLGVVQREHLTSGTFTLPASAITNWDDVSRIQISIRNVASTDDETVYVDSMWLTVHYDDGLGKAVEEEAPIVDQVTASKSWKFSSIVGAGRLKATVDEDESPSIHISGVAGSNVHIYNAVDPAFSVIVGIGSEPQAFPIYSFRPGTFIAVDTADQDACATRTLEECRTTSGYIGELMFSVLDTSSTTAKRTSQATTSSSNENTSASTTSTTTRP